MSRGASVVRSLDLDAMRSLIAGLQETTGESSSAVTRQVEQVEAIDRQIEQNLATSASIAERVAGDAGQGDEAVRRTQEAMERIRSGVESAAAGLAQKGGELRREIERLNPGGGDDRHPGRTACAGR